MAEKRDILWRFLGDAKGLDRASRDAQKDLGRVQKGMSGVGKAAGLLGGALAGAQVATFAKDAVEMAIAADEAASKFGAVFGESEAATQAMAGFADKAGVATAKSQDLFATLGNLTQAQGFSADASLDLTEDVGILAGDLASFNDADPAEVFRELGFAITTTERDALKKYGIAVSENEVKQRALNLAVKDGRDEVTKADRAQATYNIVLEQAGGAVGDLDRTSDSMANTQRRLTARWQDAQTELGRKLLPAIEDMVPLLEDAIPLMGAAAGVAGEFAEQLGFIVNPMDNMSDSVEDNRSNLEKWGDTASGWLDWVGNGTSRIPILGRAVEGLSERMDRIGGNTREAEQAAADYNAVIDRSHSHVLDLDGPVGDLAGEFGILAGNAGTSAGALGEVKDEIKETLTPLEEYQELLGITDQKMQDIIGTVEESSGVGFGGIGQGQGAPVTRRPSQFARDRFGGDQRTRQAGGVVPGRRGQPVPIIAHGGEHFSGNASGGGGASVVINFNGVVGDPDAVAAQIADLFTRYQQTNAIPIDGLSSF